MSFAGMSITSSALAALQSAENVVSDDIANVNTTGASQQNAVFTQVAPITGDPAYPNDNKPGTTGDGVLVKEIQRVHDNSLDTLVRAASSSQNYFTSQNTGLTAIQTALNEPNGGLNSVYTSFQSAVSTLASETAGSTSDSSNRQAVFASAQTLVQTLNGVGTSIQNQQTTTIATATTDVTTVNGILDQIAALNGEIRESTAAGDNPNTYEDQRDTLIDQLATYVPTATSVQNNGSTLVTVNGYALVNDTVAYHLSAPVVGTSATGEPQLKVGFASDPNPSNPTAIPLGNGQIGGLVDLYNNQLSTYSTTINGVAASVAAEFDRVNESGYDENGQAGVAIFSPAAAGQPVTAATITLNITTPEQLATSQASTSAGNLVQSVNASNTAITTSTPLNLTTAPFNGNPLLDNPPTAGGINGNLTVAVDGLTNTFAYNTAPGGNAATIGDFVDNFNKAQLGVTASYNQTGQNIVFTRDPSNESLALKSNPGYSPTPAFTLTDSNGAVGTQAAAGTTATDLLSVLGAGRIDGVQQNASNAFGVEDNANADAMQGIFSSNVGIPPAGTVNPYTVTTSAAIAAGTQTVGVVSLGNLAAGQTVTIDPGTASQENVVITAVNASSVPPTFTGVFANAHAAGAVITAAPQQTIAQYYANFVSQIGFDTQTASTGQTTQTSLTNTLDQQRQSVDGINLDQETQKLVQYQTAYQAAARTFSTLESLLTTVLTQLGVGS